MIDFSKLPDVRSEHPELTEDGELVYAAHMQARENAYTHIFGKSHPNGNILVPSVDPDLMINWPGGGVYQYEPVDGRTGWHYITHGLSQPDEPNAESEKDPDICSGFGIELVISTPHENYWAPDVLLNMVRYLLFQENSRVILPLDRLPCNGPLVLNTDTKLTHLLAVSSPEYENEIRLPGGRCDLVHMVGVTDAEINYAKEWGPGYGGSEILQKVLERNGVGTLSDPERECLTEVIDFRKIWNETEVELESLWRADGWNGEGKA